MYVLFEYVTLLALAALISTLLFTVSAVFAGVREWFLRMSRRTVGAESPVNGSSHSGVSRLPDPRAHPNAPVPSLATIVVRRNEIG
jgi:hypothetical protein